MMLSSYTARHLTKGGGGGGIRKSRGDKQSGRGGGGGVFGRISLYGVIYPASQKQSTITPTSIYQHNMKSRVRPIRNSGFNGNLTLPMPRLLSPKNKDAHIFESHLNPVMLVFIGLLLLSTIR